MSFGMSMRNHTYSDVKRVGGLDFGIVVCAYMLGKCISICLDTGAKLGRINRWIDCAGAGSEEVRWEVQPLAIAELSY